MTRDKRDHAISSNQDAAPFTKSKASDKGNLPKSEHSFPHQSPHEKAECTDDDEIPWSGDLMRDLAKELDDEWDSDDDNFERKSCQEMCYRPCKEIGAQAKTCVPVTQPSVSRTGCVSHIAPVTSMSWSTREFGKGVVHTPSPMLHGQTCVGTCDDVSKVTVVKETPPLSTKDSKVNCEHESSCSATPNYCQQTPVAGGYRNTVSTGLPLSSTPLESTSTYNTPNFRTPSTSEWMKVKRLSSSSTNTPPSFNDSLSRQVFSSGGKVTPPLCNCGKRTKRRRVSNPGPNEGKTFYACPNGKASDKSRGCGFFKWERKLANNSSLSSYSSSLNVLEPEYFESSR